MAEAYKHDYSGSCDPCGRSVTGYNTFSVGVFQWIPKASGKGLKRSAVKVRVSGYVGKPENVYNKANEIICQLDNNNYHGPKNVKVK